MHLLLTASVVLSWLLHLAQAEMKCMGAKHSHMYPYCINNPISEDSEGSADTIPLIFYLGGIDSFRKGTDKTLKALEGKVSKKKRSYRYSIS